MSAEGGVVKREQTPNRSVFALRNAMKPADHPEFFRFPAPEGRSRESPIRLDGQGRFWHDGDPVEHPRLARALTAWIDRHPDDGRYILNNGYDWTYLTVDDAPYLVSALRIEPQQVVLVLSDGSEEAWNPESTRAGADGALYAIVKRLLPKGPYEAKFTRHAQLALAPILVGEETGNVRPGGVAVQIGDRVQAIGAKTTMFG
jgi:hypothetical protein